MPLPAATPSRACTSSVTVCSSALFPMNWTFDLSGAARMTSRTKDAPVDAAIVGIVDSVAVDRPSGGQ